MLYLQELAKQGPQQKYITVSARLPTFIGAPCALNVKYWVEAHEDSYFIHLEVQGELTVVCQRCMQDFTLNYKNPTTIAVARSDQRAEQLLEQHECIVSSNWQVNLEDLVVDDLHLYVPQAHNEIEDCDQEINQFLTGKAESY